jgi:hypothetical protein
VEDYSVKPQPHSQATSRRPAGQPTRGKTARNRLRRVDNFMLRYDPGLLRRRESEFAQALFVDLGYGAEPFTTLESAKRFRRINPTLRVLGVEIDPERVVAAQPYADALTVFRLGGFNIPLQVGSDGQPESVRLIRVFNGLRQYEEPEVAEAYALMTRAVPPGGLLIEGTSDPLGRIWVANVLRKADAGWIAEALVFSTNFRTGFEPGEFQTVLPKNLIHRVIEGEPIYDFFRAWKRATLETSAMQAWGVRSWFAASALRLAEYGFPIDRRLQWLRHGYLIWQLG